MEHPLPLMCKWFYEFHKGNNKSDVSYIDENSSDVCSGSQKSIFSTALNSHRQYGDRVKRLGREHLA